MAKHNLTDAYTTGSQIALAKITTPTDTAMAGRRRGPAWLMVISVLLGNQPAGAMADFIVFPSVTGTQSSVDSPNEHFKRYELLPKIDFFLSAEKGRFRFLGEILTSSDYLADVERLQAGWLVNADNTVWFGRHHSPLGYWNTQFHHGAYLQTAVNRPAISAFDDDGGVLPMHVTGLSLEGQHTLANGNASLPYSFSTGLGPSLDPEEGLQALDLLHINRGDHKLATTLRLGYRPDSAAASETGIFVSYGLIPGDLADTREIRQSIAGAYTNWEQGAVRVIGEVYAVHNDLKGIIGAAASSGSFISANVQTEYALNNDWTFYARAENTFSDKNDPYLAKFHAFIRQRNLAGVRFELNKHQVLTVELANSKLQDERFNRIDLQWSAVFP